MRNTSKNTDKIPADVLLKCAISEYQSSTNLQMAQILEKVSLKDKIKNESEFKKLYDKLLVDLGTYKNSLQGKLNFNLLLHPEVKCKIIDFILEIDKKKLIFNKRYLKFFFDHGFQLAAEEFISRSIDKESKLTHAEIYQAVRNVLIMNILQFFLGVPLKITPAVYAYSLLYPYTDNYLDNSNVSIEAKTNFNKRLSAILDGQELIPTNSFEKKVFSLVHQIETQHSRVEYPEVFESLLLIQDAQIQSMEQIRNKSITQNEILLNSFYKGGSSVLADAFLVKGNLTLSQMHFSFNFGTFLQLLDDISDAEVDKKDNNKTLFSYKNNNETIDSEVKKLISYMFKFSIKDRHDTQSIAFMKESIFFCTLLMIMFVIGQNPKKLSKNLYKELESYSRVRLSFFKKVAKWAPALFV